MLRDRLISAAILISLLSVLLVLDSKFSTTLGEGVCLLPALLFFAIGTTVDLCNLLASSNRPINRTATIAATALITLSACVPLAWEWFSAEGYPATCPVGPLGWIVVASITGIFWILLCEMYRYNSEISGTIERTMAGVFVSLYVGLPMAMLTELRMLGEGNWGLAALLTMIATTKSADAGAYFVGRALGKTKLVPRLSPGKTRAGAVGGIVTATIVAFACLQWLFPWILSGGTESGSAPLWWWSLILGPSLAIAGMIGDLAESLVKRDTDAKDSGNTLPGLGGVWDVTDSLIAAVMPAFLCFAAAS